MATFSQKELVQNKDIYRRATFAKQAILCSIKFFRTATFSTKLMFQKRYLLRKATFLQKLHFRNSSFFKNAILYNLLFNKRYFYAAALLFHSYTSYTGLSLSRLPSISNISLSRTETLVPCKFM